MLADADFSQATVTLYRPSAPAGERLVPLEVIDRTGAPGHVPLPAIVWEPAMELDLTTDELVLVVISDVAYFERGDLPRADQFAPGPVFIPFDPERPSSFAYSVRILGGEPNRRASPEDVLAAIGGDERT